MFSCLEISKFQSHVISQTSDTRLTSSNLLLNSTLSFPRMLRPLKKIIYQKPVRLLLVIVKDMLEVDWDEERDKYDI